MATELPVAFRRVYSSTRVPSGATPNGAFSIRDLDSALVVSPRSGTGRAFKHTPVAQCYVTQRRALSGSGSRGCPRHTNPDLTPTNGNAAHDRGRAHRPASRD